MDHLRVETSDTGWEGLYKTGGAAALALVVIILLQFAAFMISTPPYEGSAADWFDLFQQSKLLGLVSFELMMVVYTILSIPLVLALFIALRGVQPSLAVLYLALSLVGTVAFIVARPAFEMLILSERYAAATTESQKTVFLAAGEGMLANFHGTAFQISYYLGSLNGLIVAAMMLKSKLFSKTTAYLRIGSSVCDFGLLIPSIGIYISIFSVFFLLAWDLLVARRLFQLGRPEQQLKISHLPSL